MDRDAFISFEEEDHIYTITNPCDGKKFHPKSVTTIIHNYFPPFDADNVIKNMKRSKNWPSSPYFGLSDDEIKDGWEKNRNEAATLGTAMHKQIEDYMLAYPNVTVMPDTKEFTLFLEFWDDFKQKYPDFRVYKAEWIVYGDKIAGSIDLVLTNDKEEIIILDWKRSKEIKTKNFFQKGYPPFQQFDDCNYTHYSIQLNIYRHLIETFYNKKVVGMFLVILHPNQTHPITIPVCTMNIASFWNMMNEKISITYY